jgi:hypothetical protein
MWRIYMIRPVRSSALSLLKHGLALGAKLGLLYRRDDARAARKVDYSIGVVTYIRRYEEFFRPLLTALARLFPDVEIIVAVNGYYDQTKQEEYLRRIGAFGQRFPNVRLLLHHQPQCLARLWNQLILNAKSPKVLILNDDVLLFPAFRRQLESCGALDGALGLLKRSWSHFVISKAMVRDAGWFDERFPGVGNEDEDFEARLFLKGIPVPSFSISALRNIVVQTKDFSYGKDMRVINKKYTSANRQFFESKWEVTEKDTPGFVYVPILGKWARLRTGMETPDFYPEFAYAAGR